MKKVYLAGPDVFYPNAKKQAVELKRICAYYGLEGVFPLDAELVFTPEEDGPTKARRIFEANVAMLRVADGVLANCTIFRGPSLDVGTAWEMGFATGLGKPVVAYDVPETEYKDRVSDMAFDDDGCTIEDFGLSDNLMPICGSSGLYEQFSRGAAKLALLLRVPKPAR